MKVSYSLKGILLIFFISLGAYLVIHYELNLFLIDQNKVVAFINSFHPYDDFVFVIFQIFQVLIVGAILGEITEFIVVISAALKSMHGLYPVRYDGAKQTVDLTSYEQALQFSPDGKYAGPVTCAACHTVNQKGIPVQLSRTEYYDDYGPPWFSFTSCAREIRRCLFQN